MKGMKGLLTLQAKWYLLGLEGLKEQSTQYNEAMSMYKGPSIESCKSNLVRRTGNDLLDHPRPSQLACLLLIQQDLCCRTFYRRAVEQISGRRHVYFVERCQYDESDASK